MTDLVDQKIMRLIGQEEINKLEHCISVCDEVLSVKPSCVQAVFERGVLHLVLGNSAAAAQDFFKYLNGSDDFSANRLLLALSSIPNQVQRQSASSILDKLSALSRRQELEYLVVSIFFARTYLPDDRTGFVVQAEKILEEHAIDQLSHPIWIKLLIPLLEAYNFLGEHKKWHNAKKLLNAITLH